MEGRTMVGGLGISLCWAVEGVLGCGDSIG